MNDMECKQAIIEAMQRFGDGDLAENAVHLLGVLGYRSELTLELSGDVADFIAQFPAGKPDTVGEQAFRRDAQSVRILFQLTDAETTTVQSGLFDAKQLEKAITRSFLFVAVELKGESYVRGEYAQFTREINKRFFMPVVVLFKTADQLITLSFVHRRLYKKDPNRDVLGSVSLIREIAPHDPHRAHLDILAELSLSERLQWMDANGKPHNFDGLLAAWLDTLDIEKLNNRFYIDLFAWFETAVSEARFPTRERKVLKPEEHIIRLITRLLFVWFIKEKGLVAEDLFVEARVKKLLKDYDREGGDSYYRAVLQNLFFATLNTEIDKRGFSKKSNTTHRDFSRYRYKRELAGPDALLDLFRETPFINGGLFDCLDSEVATGDGGYRIDCFSDNPRHGADLFSIPNGLFFSDDGLISLFNRYKFTVEENTPIEQEVALDPELLGKVFENLLAAYNPETRETVRKQTGSYYTPREVVDYMVDEALVATLVEKCPPADADVDFYRDCLRYLLDYEDAFEDAHELFEEAEASGIVRAISEIKVLDPAVGSGAFPMGVLHKLTLALRRLDPDNKRWKTLQRERARAKADAAFATTDQQERDAELLEISETFERYRDSDFGRKLYLIQNSIFGVDIQTIATQIAKLRFFISLAIEQEPDESAENFGIKPLPNLETRFVTANTLLGLEKPVQLTLGQTAAVKDLERQLSENREQHFHATTRPKKLECWKRDGRLRSELAKKLKQDGWAAGDADKVAGWDPYDQNAVADWFDAEYMFGVTDGFDVVIGNPPYVRQEDIQPKVYKDSLTKAYSDAATSRSDLYCYFYARGVQLLVDGGMHVFICSNSWLDVGYGAKLQEYLLANAHICTIYESAIERQFSTADINTIISVIQKTAGEESDETHFVQLREPFEMAVAEGGNRRKIWKTHRDLRVAGTSGGKYVGDKWGGKYLRAPNIYHTILGKCADKLVRLGDIATVKRGITTGANEFFYLTSEKIKQWSIEPEFYQPVMTSPQQSRSIAVDPALLPKKLFMCHKYKGALAGTGALEYIEWGEEQGYHERSSCRSRPRWYDLGKRGSPQLVINRRINTTSRTFLPIDFFLVGDTLYEIDNTDTWQLCAAMNSTFFQLAINVEGRSNFGGGSRDGDLRNETLACRQPAPVAGTRARAVRQRGLGCANAIGGTAAN